MASASVRFELPQTSLMSPAPRPRSPLAMIHPDADAGGSYQAGARRTMPVTRRSQSSRPLGGRRDAIAQECYQNDRASAPLQFDIAGIDRFAPGRRHERGAAEAHGG